MQYIEINGNTYYIKDKWENIRLIEVQGIASIPCPDKLLAMIRVSSDEKRNEIIDSINAEDLQAFVKYYRECFYILSDVPLEVINKIDVNEMTDTYNKYLMFIVSDILSFNPSSYKGESIKSFMHDNIHFYLPETLDVGEGIPMYNETSFTFSEAFDCFKIEQLHLFMALLCRQKNEKQLNEDDIITRSESFKYLPMSVVWQVFFYSLKQLQQLNNALSIYSMVESQQVSSGRQYRDQGLGILALSRAYMMWRVMGLQDRLSKLN